MNTHSTDAARSVQSRRWLPVLAVLLVILGVTGGARLVAAALRSEPGGPVGIEGVVAIEPRPGWLEEPSLRTDGDGGAARFVLVRGTASLVVTGVDGFGDGPHVLASEYAAGVLEARFVQVTIGTPAPVTVGMGLPGVRFGYVGLTADRVQVEGVVTAATTPQGAATVFDAFAAEGDLAGVADDLQAMIDGAVLGAHTS